MFDTIVIAETELDELQDARAVLALTDVEPDTALDAERRAAALLAARLDVPLVLHDRSREPWGETPPMEGPMDVGEVAEWGRPHLVEQMEGALALGAPRVWAVATSAPLLSEAIEEALTTSGADVVVVPEGYRPRNLFTRLQVWATERGWVATGVRGRTVRASTDGHLHLVAPLLGVTPLLDPGQARWPPDTEAA